MTSDLTYAEENYLKAIWHLGQEGQVGTNDLSDYLNTKASSVTDMLKRLNKKRLINYVKYQGARLTPEGKRIAIYTIRKHRLWEVFLVEKLNFKWDEVHEVAEQLEHIKSPKLIKRLAVFLDHPKSDPHGDPIPDENGVFDKQKHLPLSDCHLGEKCTMVGVGDSSSEFLQFLDQQELTIGTKLEIKEKFDYDNSIKIELNKKEITLSEKAAQNILIV